MTVTRRACIALAVLALLATTLSFSLPAAASHGVLSGIVTDKDTSQPIVGVCVTIGPPARCATFTKTGGAWTVSLEGAPDGLAWDVGFFKDNAGCLVTPGGPSCAYGTPVQIPGVIVNGATTVNAQMVRDANAPPAPQPPAPCVTARADVPTSSAYLPNITKTLGGPTGFQTPFIVQNTGVVNTTMEISFYKFSDGTCVKRYSVDRASGTSYAYVPNNDVTLADDSQFSVVVRSYGAPVVSVVNEHQGVGERAEALSYVGASEGAKSVFLPNITRRFFGFVTPFIIQNLGTQSTTANAQFVSRTSSAPPVTVLRVIEPGRSQFVDPNSTPGLVDGTAYSVTVTAADPIAVVVNTHKDSASEVHPVAYSTNGTASGAQTIYGPYAAKNAQGIGRISTVVVQNVGTIAASPTITFTPLGGGTPAAFPLGNIDPTRSAAFDPRYQNGDSTSNVLCGPSGASNCLADGEFTFSITSNGGAIAAAVNVISDATAMGYSAATKASARVFLPNVTKTLGGAAGWTTPILLQSVTATSAQLRWYKFSDGSIVHTQTVALTAGAGIRIDPRDVPELPNDTQFAVVVDATGGTVDAIVIELATGGDNAMIYEGFPASTP
ncbi:MAG: hypothetical protein HY071_03710 [Chloroflexi bacterium]|nr:hypothetical protein [Chloroflexota bacterium]